MANIKQARKRVITQNNQRAQNNSFKSDVRSAMKRVDNLVDNNKTEEAKEAFKDAVQKIDKAVGKGLMHRNKGNRQKARLSRRVKSVTA
ncbi:30S ribosomal protein S20 [Pontibacillus chungwhensis BH030062]|uniref:Small ribosomal subunit protein bS20 n=3 Tax=Pontibacillus TaxID=289201 RepID=A0A0A2UUQ7_9BACI|nr:MULTISPECIES: 30S ribosomal protein S20 [Pontibacillus]KGP90478.1 30S ribosomal protein S20 [Pontibacillus chungwhensis BH030062]MCD5323636.1 30S ribosomal protein S20 [Pontibacillus sp. HN14]QSS99019.1 30S ribosomal protein S20 [Pontibacillus sp. ALD_SL1]WIF97003.1 30S ribosomal protein S20 [Pontibacillus chungwhensis]GGD04332.1 30S ribosomal protein S20 [Pontibacillus salipaludis]